MNAYTSISGGGFQPPSQSPTYDPNGNMLVAAPVSGAVSYSYDRENILRTITTGTDTVSHTYDALGRLIQTETPAATGNRERYTWAGWTLLTREIFTGTASTSTHRYTWGLDLSGTPEGAGGVGGLLAIERNVTGNSAWDIRYPHYDANGNIIALSDSAGNVSARYRYDAFGKTLSTEDTDSSGWATHNIHGFSTKPNIANTGLLYYGYRHYAPTLGRWINRDPIEEVGGVNLYGFVGNSGANKCDFLGLHLFEIIPPGFLNLLRMALSYRIDSDGIYVARWTFRYRKCTREFLGGPTNIFTTEWNGLIISYGWLNGPQPGFPLTCIYGLDCKIWGEAELGRGIALGVKVIRGEYVQPIIDKDGEPCCPDLPKSFSKFDRIISWDFYSWTDILDFL